MVKVTATKQVNKQSIVKATPKDIDAVFYVLSTCTKWLSEKGMKHWEKGYTFEKVQERLRKKEVYLAYEGKDAVGTISLSNNPDSYYTNLTKRFWADRNATALYVGGLAVLPKHHGKGLAKMLLKFAEDTAREREIEYVRFDAVSNYKELIRFYLKRGYKIVGKEPGKIAESTFFEKKI